MDIQNISKKDREVTISLSADELVKICNTFYQTEERKDDLYHKLYSELMIARDLCQYGHIDNFCLSRIVKNRNSCMDKIKGGVLPQKQAEIFNTYIVWNDMPMAFGNSDWNMIYSMIVGNTNSDKIKEWRNRSYE